MVESLLINHIIKINYLTKEQLNKIFLIIEKNPKVFFSEELLKIKKTVSFFSFFLKEFFEYSTSKSSDGTYYFKLRKKIRKIQQLKEKNEKLKKAQK